MSRKPLLSENPSGHLPATFERRAKDNPTFDNYYEMPGTNKIQYKEGISVVCRGYEKNNVKPLFPFGFGLSYTTFKYLNLAVKLLGGDKYEVSFDVTNNGSRIVIEAGGGYETLAVSILANCQLPVSAVNRKHVRNFAKGLGKPAKTQCIDSALLAVFGD